MSPNISLSCCELYSLKWTDVCDAKGWKRSNDYTDSEKLRKLVRLDFKYPKTPAERCTKVTEKLHRVICKSIAKMR